jgi:hypothetical protein
VPRFAGQGIFLNAGAAVRLGVPLVASAPLQAVLISLLVF